MSELIVFILECIGTIAFAITGVLVAVESKLDFFGVVFVGTITAVGGGILRDIILGITPPLIFENLVVISIALIVSVVVFWILYIKKSLYKHKVKIEYINNFFDAIGLGVFSVMGAEVAANYGYESRLLIIAAGMLTGIGGGMLRDLMTNNIPFVLRKYVYAVAALIGIIVFYTLKKFTQDLVVSSVVAVLLITVIRLLAAKYRWKLPKVDIEESV